MKEIKDLVIGDKVWVVSDKYCVYSAEVIQNKLPKDDRHYGYVEVTIKDLDVSTFEYHNNFTTAIARDYPDNNVVIEYTLYADNDMAVINIKNAIQELKDKIRDLDKAYNKVVFDCYD